MRGSVPSNATIAVEAIEPPTPGSSLAPVFFQASLIPYLLFLYFLNYKRNYVPHLANFGFQYLLLFVIATAVAGVLSQKLFDSSLANVDWIHGSAESLLTISNIFIVIGFKDSMSRRNASMKPAFLIASGTTFLLVAFVIYGTIEDFEEHNHFLWGFGNTHQNWPWVVRAEPENALSIPTWIIHGMSVVEYIVAMNLVWKFAEATGNPRWKGLTWGMMPNHASSICAVMHHFFYNNDKLLFLVTMQAFFTMLGSTTTMIATFRIARSNGWTLGGHETVIEENSEQQHLQLLYEPTSNVFLLTKLMCFTLLLSYVIKYGELAFFFPETSNVIIALMGVISFPFTMMVYYAFLSFKEHFVVTEETSSLLEHSGTLKSNGTFA
jgi:hypothetical protein